MPLITVPYVSRVLGPSGIGTYSYTYSIVCYFMHLGLLGIGNYGNRKIAKCQNDKESLSKNFISIYIIQLFMSLLSISMYSCYIIFFCKKYITISIIQIIYLISTIFDINWFFYGLEQFKITVIKSTIIKLLSLIAIFFLVNSSDDLWIYTIILASSTLLSQIVLWPYLLKKINFVIPEKKMIIHHIKPIVVLFLPYIATSIYKLMDKVMLGYLITSKEVGYYEQAEKIVGIPTGIITALGTVMLPRISSLIEENKEEQTKNYIDKSINFMFFLAFPMVFGICAIAKDFVPIFLGKDFNQSIVLIYYIVPTIICLSFSNIIRTHYLIPMERDKDFVSSLFSGAIINLILNLLLIPKYASVGASIGTLFAEFTVMIYQTIVVWNDLPIKKYLKEIIPYFIKSLLMFIFIYLFKYLNINSLIKILMQIFSGVLIYFVLNLKYIFNIINVKKFNRKN